MSGNKPRISVALPVCNGGEYLCSAVQSVLDQQFTDFELMIVDDGSTDDSLAVLERFAAGDERIRLRTRENRGLVATLNEMLADSRGELIARMDADDFAFPDRFGLQVAYLDQHPDVVCIGGGVELVDGQGRCLVRPSPVCGNDAVQREALQGRIPICHPSAMYRTEAARCVGGYRQDTYPAEDLDLWLRLGEIGQLDNLAACVLRYRIHRDSISVQQSRRQMRKMRMVCENAWERRNIQGEFHGSPVIAIAGDSVYCKYTVDGLRKHPTARAIVLGSENEGQLAPAMPPPPPRGARQVAAAGDERGCDS